MEHRTQRDPDAVTEQPEQRSPVASLSATQVRALAALGEVFQQPATHAPLSDAQIQRASDAIAQVTAGFRERHALPDGPVALSQDFVQAHESEFADAVLAATVDALTKTT